MTNDVITEKEFGVLELLLNNIAKSDDKETLNHRRTRFEAVTHFLWSSERITSATRQRYEKRADTAAEAAKRKIRKKWAL